MSTTHIYLIFVFIGEANGPPNSPSGPHGPPGPTDLPQAETEIQSEAQKEEIDKVRICIKVVKVHIFREGHKFLRNLHLSFDCTT